METGWEVLGTPTSRQKMWDLRNGEEGKGILFGWQENPLPTYPTSPGALKKQA